MASLRTPKHPTSTDESCEDNEMDWVLETPNGVPPVSYTTGPVPIPATPAIPTWAFPATPRAVGRFDYGIMARSSSKGTTANSDDALLSYSYRDVNELPKDFMLASKMLSIRDPWEEARASKPSYGQALHPASRMKKKILTVSPLRVRWIFRA